MQSDLPNVLVVMTDQQKAGASHLYGSPFCNTPSMERLARRGVLYEDAHTPHPLCMPARVSFWTSQYPHSHGSRRNETPMPAGATHGARLWRQAGYQLGLIGKNHCFARDEDLALFEVWCELSHGGAAGQARGLPWWRPMEGVAAAHRLLKTVEPQIPRFSYAVSEAPLEDTVTGLLVGQAVRFLERHAAEGSSPFALWVSLPDPHEPWVVPRAYYEDVRPRVILPPQRPGEFDPASGAPERNRVLQASARTAWSASSTSCPLFSSFRDWRSRPRCTAGACPGPPLRPGARSLGAYQCRRREGQCRGPGRPAAAPGRLEHRHRGQPARSPALKRPQGDPGAGAEALSRAGASWLTSTRSQIPPVERT